MSLWLLNAASDSTNPSFNEFSQIRSFSCVPQTLSGGAIDFVSSTEVKMLCLFNSTKPSISALSHHQTNLQQGERIHVDARHPDGFRSQDPVGQRSPLQVSVGQYKQECLSQEVNMILWGNHVQITLACIFLFKTVRPMTKAGISLISLFPI